MGRRIFTGLLLLATVLCWIEAAQYVALLSIGEETNAYVSFSQKNFSRHTTYENYYQFHTDDGSLFTGSFTAGKEFRSVKIRYLNPFPEINSPGSDSVLIFYALCWFCAGTLILWLRLNWLRKKKYFHKDEKWSRTERKPVWMLPGEWGIPVAILTAGMGIWLFFISETDWFHIRKTPDVISGKLGNTQGNLDSSGDIAADNQWIYIQDPGKGGIYRMGHDLTEPVKLTDDKSFYLNVLDGWLYYCNFHENMNIYRISADGKKRKRLLSRKAEDLHLMGEWLFFVNANNHSKLYRVKTDGSALCKLNDDPSENINLSGEWIYYIAEKAFSAGKIYRIRNNGQSRQKISDEPVQRILVHEDWIYYINPRDGQKIYRMKTDGTEPVRISDSPAWFMNMAENRIYYRNNDEESICSISPDGGTPIRLNSENSYFLHIVKDQIYYRVDFPSEKSGQFIRISTQGGTGRKVITF